MIKIRITDLSSLLFDLDYEIYIYLIKIMKKIIIKNCLTTVKLIDNFTVLAKNIQSSFNRINF